MTNIQLPNITPGLTNIEIRLICMELAIVSGVPFGILIEVAESYYEFVIAFPHGY